MPDIPAPIKSSLSFTKLVATPTDNAWAQAYNAGNLFACLALTSVGEREEPTLPSLGKESLGILETEFFTLEEKNTESIKKALIASLAKIPQDVSASVAVAFYKENVLTIFIGGSGKAILKREDKIGTLLEKQGAYIDETITSASGYLKHNDTVVLQSGAFAQGISSETVTHALDLDLPNDIVEALSPQVHEQDNGAQAAIVIRFLSAVEKPILSNDLSMPEDKTLASLYATDSEENPLLNDEPEEDDEEEKHEFTHEKTRHNKRKNIFSSLRIPTMPHFSYRMEHKRKFYLTIAVIILVLLVVSIILYAKKQADDKQHQVFQTIYSPAEQYYEEAQGLESLNKPLSRDDYLKAQAKLKEGDGKISPNSSEGKQIADLAAKINQALTSTPADDTASTKSVTPAAHSLLAVEKDTPDGLGFGQDANFVYVVTDKAVTSVSKSSGNKKEIIKNTDGWVAPVSVVPYQGYIYILDQKNGVLKYVGENKNKYFSQNAPDVSKGAGMAIDGSVWIVTTDGKVLKFTKGAADTFGITGIDKPFKNPTKIITTIDMDYVYVLDNGNSRIVKLDKKGAVQKIYATSYAKNAKDFDIQDAQKQFLLFTGDKTYALSE